MTDSRRTSKSPVVLALDIGGTQIRAAAIDPMAIPPINPISNIKPR